MGILSIKNQDLLETIYQMNLNSGKARLTDVAITRGFSKSRTNQEIKKLIDLGLVKEEKYGPLVLTELGVFEAKRVLYTHLLIKNFLLKSLSLEDISIAEKDACAIEHVVSQETIKAMATALKSLTDTTSEGITLSEIENYLIYQKRLSELNLNEVGTIISIEGSLSLRKNLTAMGLSEGKQVKLISPLTLLLDSEEKTFRKKDLETVIVKIDN